MPITVPKLRTILWRGACQKCPRCGAGAIFKKWITLNERCASCGLRYLPDQGDLWAYVVLIDRLLFMIPLIVLIFLRLNTAYSIWIYVSLAAVLFGVFILSSPCRLGMGVAADVFIRMRHGDLAEENAKINQTSQRRSP